MVAPFRAIDESMSAACMRMLADVEVTRADGTTFLAQSHQADEQPFGGHAVIDGLAIRFRLIEAPGIVPGERLHIDGVSYRVAGDPIRKDPREAIATLVEAP